MDSLIDLGYWGLFIGSFLASTLIPMSADVLLVGILALGGNVWACLVIATTGNWLGGLTSYWIGWLGRWEWIERWLKVKEEKLLRQKKNINRYGPGSTCNTENDFFKLSLFTAPSHHFHYFFLFSCSRRFICRHRFIRFHRPNNFPSPFTYL